MEFNVIKLEVFEDQPFQWGWIETKVVGSINSKIFYTLTDKELLCWFIDNGFVSSTKKCFIDHDILYDYIVLTLFENNKPLLAIDLTP